jgi:bacterial/archaeal transporter family-2 protein
MHVLLIVLAIGAGMVIPMQAGFNAEFRAHAGHPLFAAALNFLVGFSALALVSAGFLIARRASLPSGAELAQAPWWSWIGGLCGATLVFVAVIAARPLGAGALIACLVTGQLVCSVVVDHFGWLNYDRSPITPTRLLGVALLAAGLVLVLASRQTPGSPAPDEATDDPPATRSLK